MLIVEITTPTEQGAKSRIKKNVTTIGSGPNMDITIKDDGSVSDFHA